MSIDEEFDEFLDELEEVSSVVMQANQQMIAQHLRRWFTILDDGPAFISKYIQMLENQLDWETVEKSVFEKNSGMGPDTLNWPDKKLDRLSAQLKIFRKFATGKIEAWRFAHQFVYVRDGNIDDTLQEFMYQVFVPFLTELKRDLKRQLKSQYTIELAPIPASDRIVSLDHNSRNYADAISMLESTIQEVNKSNSIDTQTKERIVAELHAGKGLLTPQTARLHTLKVVLLSSLTWIVSEFASTAIAPIAQHAIDALTILIPNLI